MGNLRDYVAWRGDLSFDERPFGLLDSLVFCQLSYMDMRGAFRERKPGTLSDAVRALEEEGPLTILLADGVEKHDEYADFVDAAASSRRFGNVLLSDYEDIFDREEQIQFCALVFHIDEKTGYIAFRGTDDSIVGWKEDFMISFEKIPAQDAALRYLKETFHLHPQLRFYVGGHSKGANLALYSAALLPEALQEKILHVYVFDGPGLCSDVLDTSAIGKIDSKTTKVVPEYDVIGKIFEMPVSDSHIVKSSETGIMQHGILTWQMKDGTLDEVPENAPGSKWIGKVLDAWIGGVAPKDRKAFIDDLFDSLAAGGTTTFYEMRNLGPDGFEKVLAKAAKVSPVSLDVAASLPLTAAVGPKGAENTKNVIARLRDSVKTSQTARAAILAFGGIFCMVIPDSALPLTVAIMMTVFVGSVLVYTIHELWKSRFNLSAVQTQSYICIISIVVYCMLIVKEGALMLISNLVYGIVFLMLAYHIVQRMRELPKKSWHWAWSLTEASLLVIMALFILTAPSGAIRYFTFSCGCIFLADGLIHLVLGIRDRNRSK